jgi:hypothetical protein
MVDSSCQYLVHVPENYNEMQTREAGMDCNCTICNQRYQMALFLKNKAILVVTAQYVLQLKF